MPLHSALCFGPRKVDTHVVVSTRPLVLMRLYDSDFRSPGGKDPVITKFRSGRQFPPSFFPSLIRGISNQTPANGSLRSIMSMMILRWKSASSNDSNFAHASVAPVDSGAWRRLPRRINFIEQLVVVLLHIPRVFVECHNSPWYCG